MLGDKKKMILIVEDERALLGVYAEQLTGEGFSVLKASNGQEGLETALKKKPDLILTDILMPVMDGLTMVQKLRKSNPWCRAVPIILLTNLTVDEEKIKEIVTQNQPAYYFSKSTFTLQTMVEKIKLSIH